VAKSEKSKLAKLEEALAKIFDDEYEAQLAAAWASSEAQLAKSAA